jgi:single stranded DNA-binding protein
MIAIKERGEWHHVVVFNEWFAGVAEKHRKKGAKVYVEGQLQTRKWIDQACVERYSTKIVLACFKGEMTMPSSANSSERAASRSKSNEGGYLPGTPVRASPIPRRRRCRTEDASTCCRAVLEFSDMDDPIIHAIGRLAGGCCWRLEASALSELAGRSYLALQSGPMRSAAIRGVP